MTVPRIVVVGSTNTDLVVGVGHLPAPGETVLGGALQTVPGGKGANQAVAVSRLGGQATFIARVGDDAFGKASLGAFAREGIDTRFVGVTPGVASGVALISVAETTGQNTIVVASGANAFLTPEDVEAAEEAFDTAQAVVISLEIPLDAVASAIAQGRVRRIPVLLNPAPARALPPELLGRVSILVPNESEAIAFAGGAHEWSEPIDYTLVAARLLETGIDAAVITLGAAGALLATPDGIAQVPPPSVRAIDTVGAGDCFTGALAVEVARGRSLRDAVEFANRAAALKVTRRGAQAGIPTRAEIAGMQM